MNEHTPSAAIGLETVADLTRVLNESLPTSHQLHEPTIEQARVITAAPGPVVVVAGAGSGKTETMAWRVLWAVAQGHASADRVLGLTFTRKATRELRVRLRQRLQVLFRSGGVSAASNCGLFDSMPTVATYHSYASSLVKDHGLRIGVDPSIVPVGPASALAIAEQVSDTWTRDLTQLSLRPERVAEAIYQMSSAAAEHLVSADQIEAHSAALVEAIIGLPAKPGGQPAKEPKSGKVFDVLKCLRDRMLLAPMVEQYEQAKRNWEVMDHGDLIRFAARIATECPDVCAQERDRFALVLLDEFQDTSYAQFSLLRSLFQGSSVTAVGDPHQSIYAWRGASAANLSDFRTAFAEPGDRAQELTLSTSWRNDCAVLAVANAVAEPLAHSTSVNVGRLQPRPGAGPGEVQMTWHRDSATEYANVAEFIGQRWQPGQGQTAAVLCRTRGQFQFVVAALREAGMPVATVGSGGLLHSPAVADVIALLHLAFDDADGAALAPLVAGPMLRLGPADLRGWYRWAVARQRETDPEAPYVSLAASVADLPAAAEELREVGVSQAGIDRLSWLAHTVSAIRRSETLGVVESVAAVIRYAQVDIEHATRGPAGDAAAATSTTLDVLAQLDEFLSHVSEFALTAPRPTMSALLRWLEYARIHERGLDLADLDEAGASAEDDRAVMVLTAHAAKGLEWDVVAVPGLAAGMFPAKPRVRIPDLTDVTSLSHDLRGDRASLPRLDVGRLASMAELKAQLASTKTPPAQADSAAPPPQLTESDAYADRWNTYHTEQELRLAYVAVTRAKHALLLTGASWTGGKLPRRPADFLLDAAGVVAGQAGCTVETVNLAVVERYAAMGPPELQRVQTVWPDASSPLATGACRSDLVRACLADVARGDAQLPRGALSDAVDELLQYRQQRRDRMRAIPMESHVSATQVYAMSCDPAGFAQDLRRPMPTAPSAAARLGTAFHQWLQREMHPQLPLLGDHDMSAQEEIPAHWKQHYAQSRWAAMTPAFVEVPVQLPLDAVMVRGRIDAVFVQNDQHVVVDWKTGRVPTGAAREAAQAQLRLYRQAWAAWSGRPMTDIQAVLFYVAEGVEMWCE